MIRLIYLAGGLSGAVAVSWWLFVQLESPWGWFAGVWALTACLAGYPARSGLVRMLWFNAAAALVAFGAAEAWISRQAREGLDERWEGRYTQDYFVADDLLGYGPARGGQFSARRYVGGEKVYDTVYTINANGLRITPTRSDPKPDKSVLFFGGSVTFGEGVADNESMPYRVGELTDSSYQVYNFGFHGYGPHQMLATLESGRYADIIAEEVAYVIYQALPEHVPRVIGLTPWDRHGPWYRKNDQGEIEFAGSFSDRHGHLMNGLLPLLERSNLYQRILGLQRSRTKDDVDIYVGVVARARDLAQELFPGCEFHVIMWDDHPGGLAADAVIFDQLLDGLTQTGIQIHLISDILPDYKQKYKEYHIGEYEPHPAALAHDIIARYIVSKIFAKHE